MRICNLRRIIAALLVTVMLCGVLGACTPEDLDTLNAMFEDLYSSSDNLSFGFQTEQDTVITGDTENLPESGITLDELMEGLNEERKNDVRTNISDADIFLPDYESDEFQAIEFSEEELDLLTTPNYEDSGSLTMEEIENDVDYLFRILKTSYAPYEYFGGDEVFNKAKEDILNEVHSYTAISTGKFESIIMDNLSFMMDSHFSLNMYSGVDFAEQVYYYDSEKRELRTDDKGYFLVVDGVKYYVDENDEEYLKLTVGESGELVYAFIAMCEEKNSGVLPREFTLLSDKNDEIILDIKWKTDRYNYTYNLTWEDEVDGIPLTGIGMMAIDDDNCIEEMNDFVNRAKELRDEEIFILDLRGNSGGLSTISYMWMYNLTNGKEVEGEYTMVYYMSMLNYLVTMGNDEEIIDALLKFDFFNENPDQKEELLSEEEEDELGEGYVYDTEDSWNEYDGTIFVLCDKAVSSAGEMFILELMDVENVVVFGTNSNGCLISGGTNYYVDVYLPNSGISIYYSTALILTDDSEDFDARGVQPDVIICGEDEAEAAARCWNYYN